MVKSLHRSLEAKLASIEDPEYTDSESEVDGEHSETISAKRAAKGKGGTSKRKQGKKDDATSPQQSSAANDGEDPSTVIYLGHLPVGFEEREITAFLNQFGSVNRCRVSRSTKTGRSRCYAFVEFVDPDVATIVADTMSGYLLLEKRLVCHVLPRNKVDHELMFARPKRVPTKKDRQKKARSEMNKARSKSAISEITARLVKREEIKRKNLEALGIEYDFPGYAASAAAVAAPSAVQSSATSTAGSEAEKGDGVSSTKEKKKRKLSSSDVEAKEDVISDELVNNNLESKKKKKSKKRDLNVKSGGELERGGVQNNVSSDLSKDEKNKIPKKEEKKETSKKVVTQQKRGEEVMKRVTAGSESLKKKATKTKAKMPKKG